LHIEAVDTTEIEERQRFEAEEETEVRLRIEVEYAAEIEERLHIETEEKRLCLEIEDVAEDEECSRIEAEEKHLRFQVEDTAEDEECLHIEAEKNHVRIEAEDAAEEDADARIETEEEAARLQSKDEQCLYIETKEDRVRIEGEDAVEQEGCIYNGGEEERLRINRECAVEQDENARIEGEEEAARLPTEEEECLYFEAEEERLRIEADDVAEEQECLYNREEEEHLPIVVEEIERLGIDTEEGEEGRLRIEAEALEAKSSQGLEEKCAPIEGGIETGGLQAEDEGRLRVEAEAAAEVQDNGDEHLQVESEEMVIMQAEDNGRIKAEAPKLESKFEELAEYAVVDEAEHDETNVSKVVADSQYERNGWGSENFDNIYDEDDSDSEEEPDDKLQSALKSISEAHTLNDTGGEKLAFDLPTEDESLRASSKAEDSPVYVLPKLDESSRVSSPDISKGPNPLISFGAGFSSYIGNMPDVTGGLDFSSYISGTTNENADKDNTVADSSANNEETIDSGFSGFEAPTNIDDFNESVNASLTAAEEETMNKSMEVSAAIYDSDKDDMAPNTDEFYSESNDLDEMYGSETESQVSKEKSESEENAPPVCDVPQYAIDKFMTQLERIRVEHDLELKDMEKTHKEHVEQMKDKLQVAKQARKGGWGSEVSNHDKCLAQQRQLEKDFNAQLQQREYKIAEISEVNSLLRSQVEELTLESNGLNLTIQASKERMSEVDKKDEQIEHIQSLLSATQTDLEASKESFSTLKSRVKAVATELKDRRVECRTLNISVQELTVVKSIVEAERNDYQMRTAKIEKLAEEKDEEIANLRKEQSEMRVDLKKKEKKLSQKGNISGKAIDSYKKKAQASLANANARAATANQAREDAEIDTTNARNDAEVALKKAKEAEIEKDTAIAKAQEEVHIYLDQIEVLKVDCESTKKELCDTQIASAKATEEMNEVNKNRDEMLDEWTTKNDELENEAERALHLDQDFAIERIKNKELEDEVENLKEELENYASAAFMARQSDGANAGTEKEATTEPQNEPTGSDGTIVMLQQDLKAANEAIRDLKEAFGIALSRNPGTIEPKEIKDSIKLYSPGSRSRPSSPQMPNNTDTTEATPLFFAFEKQAEINTARDEITRLAALLGDAESTKVEAMDAMDEMRKKTEEAESRLRRYEKLAPGSGRGSSALPTSQQYNNRRSHGSMPTFVEKNNGSAMMSSQSDSTVSLEYLKNIMLRYMNANSLNEKRALVPVIGAVLELTPDEQIAAMANVEKSANVTGVGVSLIENIQNKGFTGLFG